MRFSGKLLKNIDLYLIWLTFLIDSRSLSIWIGDQRFRIVQLIFVFFFPFMVAGFFKRKFIFISLDLILLLEISLFYISSLWSPDMSYTIKLSTLILSNFLLYKYISFRLYAMDEEEKRRMFNLFLKIVMIFVYFGAYQIIASILNLYVFKRDVLWVGAIGMAHLKFAGLPYSRPYAMLEEPDWYGMLVALMSIFFLVYIVVKKNRKYTFYFFINFTLLILSVVRTAWAAFMFGGTILVGLFFLFGRQRYLEKFLIGYNVVVLILFLFFSMITAIFFPSIIEKRFSTKGDSGLGFENVRINKIKSSFESFLKSPIIGNGFGSYKDLGVWGDSEERYNLLVLEGLKNKEYKNNNSVLMLVLADTGIVGMIPFIFLLWIWFVYSKRLFLLHEKLKKEEYLNGFSLNISIAGLFLVSFISLNWIYLPWMWVFVAWATVFVMDSVNRIKLI